MALTKAFIFHCSTSSKDAGAKNATAITEMHWVKKALHYIALWLTIEVENDIPFHQKV